MLNTLLIPSITENALEGAKTFVMGMLVIFLGITIIVLSVKIAGYFFNNSNDKAEKVEKVKEETKPVETVAPVVEEGIPEHIKVAIIGAITAYYFENNKSNCDFIVRKIKRF